jgi:hypothetical protein
MGRLEKTSSTFIIYVRTNTFRELLLLIELLIRTSLSMVYVQLGDQVTDPKKQFTDMNLKLNALNATLPQGAGPIQFNSDPTHKRRII